MIMSFSLLDVDVYGVSNQGNSFYKMGETSDGRTITASFHEFRWGLPPICRRQTLVMYTGNGHSTTFINYNNSIL